MWDRPDCGYNQGMQNTILASTVQAESLLVARCHAPVTTSHSHHKCATLQKLHDAIRPKSRRMVSSPLMKEYAEGLKHFWRQTGSISSIVYLIMWPVSVNSSLCKYLLCCSMSSGGQQRLGTEWQHHLSRWGHRHWCSSAIWCYFEILCLFGS